MYTTSVKNLLTEGELDDRIILAFGKTKDAEVSEWFKELVLKTSDSERDRGFESHLLRYNEIWVSRTSNSAA